MPRFEAGTHRAALAVCSPKLSEPDLSLMREMPASRLAVPCSNNSICRHSSGFTWESLRK